MNKIEPIKELRIGTVHLSLYLKESAPFADCEGQTFAQLWPLVEKIGILSDPTYLCEFAYLSNFFWKAGLFHYIESIPDYQKFYIERIKQEREHPADLFQYRLTDFKIFDVSAMHPPKVEGGSLIYFTYNGMSGLPYRVVCPFPYHLSSTYVHYQILPIKEEDGIEK